MLVSGSPRWWLKNCRALSHGSIPTTLGSGHRPLNRSRECQNYRQKPQQQVEPNHPLSESGRGQSKAINITGPQTIQCSKGQYKSSMLLAKQAMTPQKLLFIAPDPSNLALSSRELQSCP